MFGGTTRAYRKVAFRSKLTFLTATAVVIALLLSCMGLIGLQYSTDRDASLRRHQQIARVISGNIGAAILFDDRQAARENLSSISGIDDIVWVRAYTQDDRLFAEFRSVDGIAGALNQVRYPIMLDDERIGELRLGVHYRSLMEIISDTALIAFGMFVICLSMALASSRWLGASAFRPIERMQSTMRQISVSGDYTVRLEQDPDPDFDVIVSSFNTMLDEVERSNIELSANASELETVSKEALEANLAKSQFLANMSHELRTPLNAIIGYTEVLQEELVAAKLQRSVDDVQWIYSSAKQLLVLINGILDLSKIEAGGMDIEIHEFDVGVLMREVSGMMEPIAAQRGNVLNLQIDPSVTAANTDSAKLRQCLLNLVSNACKFTENGHIFILARAEGSGLVFTVADTGIGMTPEELDRLFQPFVQADSSTTRRYGGTGLGLTITWRFAEMLGGNVRVESTPNSGSTFTLEIETSLGEKPIEVPQIISSNPFMGNAPKPERNSDKPLALIADDEPSAVQLLTRLVEQSGYETVVAGDGEQCIELARACKPDLILLDIGMPKFNGWQVLEALEQDSQLNAIPTVVVSVDDSRSRAISAGASDHLVKPVNRGELTGILNQYSTKQSGSVLIVEDDEATSRLYERGIQQMGFDVQVVRNGKDAIEALETGVFGFVVTDLRMPYLDGFQLIDVISSWPEEKRPRVVVVSGKVLDDDEAAKLKGKIIDLLPKNGLSPRILAEIVGRKFKVSEFQASENKWQGTEGYAA